MRRSRSPSSLSASSTRRGATASRLSSVLAKGKTSIPSNSSLRKRSCRGSVASWNPSARGRPCRVHSPLEPARCLIGTPARSRSRAYSKGHRFRPRSPGQCVSRPTRAQPVFFWPESAFTFRCRDQGASSQPDSGSGSFISLRVHWVRLLTSAIGRPRRVWSSHDVPGVAIGPRSCCDAGNAGVVLGREAPGARLGILSAPAIRRAC